MRIIAGSHRGRPVTPPPDYRTTRPITDRVKEALFNRLHSLGLLGYGRVLDVYCGTGSMGLEALSRGAQHALFVDRDPTALKLLRQNIDALGFTDRARVEPSDALAGMYLFAVPDGEVTVAFLDPPYADADPQREALAALLVKLAPKLEPGGVAVLRTPSEAEPPAVDALDLASVRYGGMTLHFFQSPLDEDEDATT